MNRDPLNEQAALLANLMVGTILIVFLTGVTQLAVGEGRLWAWPMLIVTSGQLFGVLSALFARKS